MTRNTNINGIVRHTFKQDIYGKKTNTRNFKTISNNLLKLKGFLSQTRDNRFIRSGFFGQPVTSQIVYIINEGSQILNLKHGCRSSSIQCHSCSR